MDYTSAVRERYHCAGNTLNSFLSVKNHTLHYQDINLMSLVHKYAIPLEVGYVEMIRQKVQGLTETFKKAQKTHHYIGGFIYAYASKASQYEEVVTSALASGASLETSSPYDVEIAKLMAKHRLLPEDRIIIHNGFKTREYLEEIFSLRGSFQKTIPVIEKMREIDELKKLSGKMQVGVRLKIYDLAGSRGELKQVVYRFGFNEQELKTACEKIAAQSNLELCMFHALVGTQIEDEERFLRSLFFVAKLYCDLWKQFPSLRYLNIGGGLPVPYSLNFSFNYERFVYRLVSGFKKIFDARNVPHPTLIGEYGRYTVAEEGFILYKVIAREEIDHDTCWYFINHSFITSLPDAWTLNQRFIALPLNFWDRPIQKCILGGITCDSDDYYPHESTPLSIKRLKNTAIELPRIRNREELYLGFFSTGAYQETLSGIGGTHHCLTPEAAELIITKKDGAYHFHYIKRVQSVKKVLKDLSYTKYLEPTPSRTFRLPAFQ